MRDDTAQLNTLDQLVFFLTIGSSPSFTLFPYTTLFRSVAAVTTSVTVVVWTRVPLVPVMVKVRSEEHTSELQSLRHLVCRLLLEKKKNATSFYPLRSYRFLGL